MNGPPASTSRRAIRTACPGRRVEPAGDGAAVGKVIRPRLAAFARVRVPVAGEHLIGAGAVVDTGMGQRADDGVFVGDACQLREMLADLDAGDVGADRLEL